MSDFKYEIIEGFDHTIDEKGNTFISLRKIDWGCKGNPRLDLRKYNITAEGERMSKGVSFLTEDGPNELAEVLVKEGYGDTKKILRYLAEREGIEVPEESDEGDDEYFDMNEIINSINEGE